MKRYVVESWILLCFFDLVMHFRTMQSLHRIVKHRVVQKPRSIDHVAADDLCRAMDYACVLYFKQVLCLQRSSATTLLLRRYGWNAEMVIGAQIRPFRSHAWVELANEIVNDRPYMRDIYQVLERC